MLSFEVLSLDVILINNIKSSFSKGISVKVLRFNGWNVSGVSWNFGDSIFSLDLLELIVYFFGNMAE